MSKFLTTEHVWLPLRNATPAVGKQVTKCSPRFTLRSSHVNVLRLRDSEDKGMGYTQNPQKLRHEQVLNYVNVYLIYLCRT